MSAFKIDDLIIDSIDEALATDFEDKPLYTLTQLSEATIDITAESTDATDKNGTLIKKVWKSKSGSFSATNAMLNLNIIGAMSGDKKVDATSTAKITMPKIEVVKGGTSSVQLPADTIAGSVKVAEQSNNGAMGKVYEAGQGDATATTYVVTSDKALNLPTDSDAQNFVVFYKRSVESGVAITNKADKFPGTVRLYLKALVYDPCTADTLRAAIIYLPSFQVSPEVSISLSADANINYKGDLQVDYCGADKVLYQIFMIDEGDDE